MLLAQLIIHVARLLNFDEPPLQGDDGWNPDAARYWERKLRYGPVDPSVSYPCLPIELTHGVHEKKNEIVFRVTSASPPGTQRNITFRPTGRQA